MPNLVFLALLAPVSRWGRISDCRISGQSLIKRNCHNSRTSDDIDMKLGSVTKLENRNIKKFDDDVMSKYCDAIAIFPIYSQFGAIWKPYSESVVCKIYIFINCNFLSYKNFHQN